MSSSGSFNCGILILSALLLIFIWAEFKRRLHSPIPLLSHCGLFLPFLGFVLSLFDVCQFSLYVPRFLPHSRSSSSVIMAVTYGYDAAQENDPFLSNATRLMEIVVSPERAVFHTAFLICEFLVRTSI